jgi:hypothetical protein
MLLNVTATGSFDGYHSSNSAWSWPGKRLEGCTKNPVFDPGIPIILASTPLTRGVGLVS